MYLTLQIHLEDTRRRQRKSPSVDIKFYTMDEIRVKCECFVL